MHDDFYRSLSQTINQTVGRKAITSKKIADLVAEARRIRATRGIMGLWSFANDLPHHFFTESEIERLKQSSEWRIFSEQMIRLLIHERVITPWEAQMVGKYL